MLIRDILSFKGGAIHSIESSTALNRAVSLMVEHDIGSLVVIDGSRMAGMLTFREVLRAIDRSGGTAANVLVRDVMVNDPICGGPADTIDDLREVMTRHHVRYLPVKEGDELLGIVSFHDVAKALIKETSMENRLLKRYIEGSPAVGAES
ncbi:MAG TPA: CBS domain-containing protein [Burkholderiales bacterium]|nr:CBS domain-containing protein [Burkholderiales bacterium]